MSEQERVHLQELSEKFDALKEEIQQLRSEVGMLRSVRHGSGVDLVILDSIVAYVPTEDNLYSKFIPDINKKYDVVASGLPEVVLGNPSNTPAKVFQDYIEIVASDCSAINLYDIGAWAGDIAIRLARYAKASKIDFRAQCYDPSTAGSLIPFNARLNNVADLVDFVPAGISLDGGPLLFNQVRGHSDSSGLSMVDSFGRDVDSYIINTYTLVEILERNKRSSHQIIKIDVEGIDALIVANNLAILQESTLVIEFNPRQEQYKIIDPRNFLALMNRTHTIYDLFYAPNPTMVDKIDDIDQFMVDILQRKWGYTDLLMVPRVCKFHDRFVQRYKDYKKEPDNYVLAKAHRAE